MTAQNLVDLLSSNASGIVIAALALLALNKVWEARLKELERHRNEIRQLTSTVISVLRQNTWAMTRLAQILDETGVAAQLFNNEDSHNTPAPVLET